MKCLREARTILFVTTAALLASCSGEHAPTSPSGPPATVSVQSIFAVRELIASDTDAYRVSFELRELGGGTGATIKAMELQFSNGLSATFGPEAATDRRIRAGGTLPVSDLSTTAGAGSRAGSVQIRVLLTDDSGADSVSLAAASVTSAYALSGRVTESATGRAVTAAVVKVTFGPASGRSAISDAGGYYLLRAIPRGPVSVTVSAPGFMPVTKVADIDSNVVVDISLMKAP